MEKKPAEELREMIPLRKSKASFDLAWLEKVSREKIEKEKREEEERKLKEMYIKLKKKKCSIL